eukprot:6212760-Pleurochrysis_carterae.AAC.1
MISLPTCWPPPRLQLHVVTLQQLTLLQLPARDEDRPDLVSGKRSESHQYVSQLSFGAPKLGKGYAQSVSISVELHAIGGFSCVSQMLPPTVGAAHSLLRASTDDGSNFFCGQKVHCVAAEPRETVLRIAVVDDDFDREVAYETVVLGVLREGYRVFHLRNMQGTRIESCSLLVQVSFGAQVNAWVGEQDLVETIHKQKETITKQSRNLEAYKQKIRQLEALHAGTVYNPGSSDEDGAGEGNCDADNDSPPDNNTPDNDTPNNDFPDKEFIDINDGPTRPQQSSASD